MSKNHTDVLLEDMNAKFDVMMEAIVQLRSDMKEMTTKADFEEVKQDVKTIKAAVTDTNTQVQDHEHRITSLEATS